MTPAARGLLDTRVFLALKSDRPMNTEMLPDESVICPVTIAELQAGVLITADVDIRARRLATLESTADIEVLAIDSEVAAEWARLRVHLAEIGRRQRQRRVDRSNRRRPRSPGRDARRRLRPARGRQGP